MKKLITCFLMLSLCAAVLCLPAFAAENDLLISPALDTAPLGPVQVWGQAAWLESGSLLLKNSDKTALHQEVVVHLNETTPVVGAVSGLPMDASAIKNGDTIYAWIGPAMTMSLPPQAGAVVVVANIPADFAVPQYYEVTGVDQTVTIATYPAPPGTEVNLPVTGGEVLRIPVSAEVVPYRTRQIVTLDDLAPGSRILVWRDSTGSVSRVLVFSYAYRGYLTWSEDGTVLVNGEGLPVSGKPVDGEILLPIRAVAEAIGLDVEWRPGKGAVVSQNGFSLLEAMPGGSVAMGDGGSTAYTCVLENGVTYISPEALISALRLFPAL